MKHNTNIMTVKTMAPYFVKFIITGINRSTHLSFWYSEGSWWHYWQDEKCSCSTAEHTLGGGSKRKTSYCRKTNSKPSVLYM